MNLENKAYLSVKEMSRLVGMHPNTIRKAIKNGKLSHIQLGEGKNSHFRIPRSELERLALVDLKEIFGIKD